MYDRACKQKRLAAMVWGGAVGLIGQKNGFLVKKDLTFFKTCGIIYNRQLLPSLATRLGNRRHLPVLEDGEDTIKADISAA